MKNMLKNYFLVYSIVVIFFQVVLKTEFVLPEKLLLLVVSAFLMLDVMQNHVKVNITLIECFLLTLSIALLITANSVEAGDLIKFSAVTTFILLSLEIVLIVRRIQRELNNAK